jgi:hypothetical protein
VATSTPFYHVENADFRKAFLVTARAGGRYVGLNDTTKKLEPRLPHRTKLSTTLLDETDWACLQMVSQLKAVTIGETGCTIASDGMVNIKNKPRVNVLYVTPSGQFFVRLINGEGETKDNAWIAARVIEAIEVEGPANVVMVVMDGACRGALSFITAKYPHIICQVCVAHALDLLLKDFAKKGTQGPVVAGEERFRFDTSWTRDRLAAGRKIVQFVPTIRSRSPSTASSSTRRPRCFSRRAAPSSSCQRLLALAPSSSQPTESRLADRVGGLR